MLEEARKFGLSDVTEAKRFYESVSDHAKNRGAHELAKNEAIAATCIGIAADILNVQQSTLSDTPWKVFAEEVPEHIMIITDELTPVIVAHNVPKLTAKYIVELHNMSLKASKAFA